MKTKTLLQIRSTNSEYRILRITNKRIKNSYFLFSIIRRMKENSVLLFYCSIILLSSPVMGQTIQNDVIASGGGHAVAGNIDMEFTIGEPVIETFEATGLTLTQGFHQPSLVLTSIEEPDMLTDISIFPNPVKDELTIEIPATYSSKILYRLFDLNGKLLQSGEFYSGSNTLEMQAYATASYVLQISDTSTGRQLQTKIMKIR